MQTAKTKGILLLLLLLTASLLLALGLALPRHTVSAQGAVATIDGVEYDSLSAAVAAAEDGVETTITLEADTADTVTISAGKVIVLNLNGNSVSVTGSAAIQNEGTLTIKGTISGAVETDAENAIENAGTLKIEGGYFKGGISNTGSVSITGGRFSKLVPASYLAENYSIQSYNTIGKRGYSISNKAPVAEITLDGTRYVFEKISTASDAAAGGTVTLIADAEQTSFITLGTPVTLDLNGYDITYKGTVSNNLIKVTGENVIITNSSQEESKLVNTFGEGSNAYSVIYAEGANLTVENVTIESKGIGISATNSDMVVKNSTITSETGLGVGFFGGMTEEEAKTDTANYNTLTLENSSVSGHTFALAGNGTKHGTAVTIQNSTLTGTIGAGIYHPQVGTLTVGGADTKISGTSGIELRAGTLTVSGGEISATAKTFETLPNKPGTDHADGSTIDGAAIAVSQHGYDPDIAVNITGGTFNGVKALYEADLQNEDVSNISVTVSGGTFKGDVGSENVTGFISGGTFAGAVDTSYVADDSVIYEKDGSNVVGSEKDAVAAGAVAVVDNTAYTTLEAAIESATEGDTIQLLQDVTIGTIIAKNSFTLDLNTYEISGGLLYISGSTAADTGIVVSISNGSINAADYGILINNNAKLNLCDVVIDSQSYGIFVPSKVNDDTTVQPAAISIQGGSVNGDDSAMVICGVGDSVATPTKLIANGTKFTGGIFGISGNGSAHNTYIELNDCSVTAGTEEGGIGIYHPQKGEIVINGSEITGIDSGIEIRAGELNISGDTVITATATEFSARPNSNGTTMSGVAVAVSQHTTNLPIAVNITGGTFNGVKALYEEDLQDEESSNISVTVSGGTFEGDVESENVTGFISGGSFQTLPNETLLGSGYAGVQYNGLYVVVKETTDAGALTVAKLAAQADIRSYSASLGFPWTDLSALSGNEKVDAILSAYNAVDAAESEGAVAVARLNALDAIDAYYTYLKGIKEAALGEIETYAAAGQDKAGVAVPTYVISAINGAVSEAEIESYVTAAKAEIDEIREQRTKLAGNFAALNTKADTLAANLKAALDDLAAIEGAVGANAKTLAALQTQLTDVEKNIKAEIAAIKTLLGTAADETGNQTLFDKIGALEAKLTTVENNIKTAVTDAVTDLSAAVKEIADAVDALPTASVDLSGIEELISGLQADIDAANAALEGLDGEVSGLASLVGSLDGAQYSMNKALEAFEDAVTEQLTAIQTSLTALAADADENGAAIAVLQQKADEIAADLQSGNADLTDVAENVVSLQGALEALSADVSAQGGMTGPIIGLYVIVSVLVVLMAAVLVILLKKKN